MRYLPNGIPQISRAIYTLNSPYSSIAAVQVKSQGVAADPPAELFTRNPLVVVWSSDTEFDPPTNAYVTVGAARLATAKYAGILEFAAIASVCNPPLAS